MGEYQPDSTSKKEKPRGLFRGLKTRKKERKKAKKEGNQLLKQVEGRIHANLNTVLPKINPEAVKEVIDIFYGGDRDQVDPDSDNIYDTVDRTIEQLKNTNPHLAELIEKFDKYSHTSEDEARYFSIMLLAALTHESTSQKK